jgi:fused signal recognition particle receptor
MSLFSYRENKGYFSRLKDALQTTKDDITYKIGQLTGTAEGPITEDQLEELEGILMGADIGVQTALEIVETVREQTRTNRFVTSHKLQRIIRKELLAALEPFESSAEGEEDSGSPRVVLVVGVNGVGKTTTIGKLADNYQRLGSKALLCASDTFRAAAIEQLEIWAGRAGCEIIRQSPGADPAAVLFDSIAAARARSVDVVIVDTAGRLHNKANLMKELGKIHRVAGREVQGAPHEVLLVLDATTGQNGLVQAREFLRAVGVTGVVITKLDGTAKGGIVVSVVRELKIPIRYVGVGEKIDDLIEFDTEAFVDSLFEV